MLWKSLKNGHYQMPDLEMVAFLKITNALKIGGALIIGSHEKIPDNIFCLRRCQLLPCLYFKEGRLQNNENAAKSIIL